MCRICLVLFNAVDCCFLLEKGAKTGGLIFISDWVQLILQKLVAPYLLC